MNVLKKKKNSIFAWALIVSIALPLGIPCIVFGAVYQLWILMAFGILCVMSGFYGCPLLWVGFGRKNYLYALAVKIEEDGVYSIDSLASVFNKDIATVLSDVRLLISKRYISNYLIDEEARMIVRHEKEKTFVTFFCPSCGASIEKNPSNKYVCDYCHTAFEYK